MRLKADPLTVFRHSHAPLALHARKRWMDGADDACARADDTVRQLLARQAEDGSWEGSVATTIQNLFTLWLLLEQRNPAVDKGVAWLMELQHPPMEYQCGDGAPYSNMFFRTSRQDRTALRRMRDVPFTPGCSGFVKTGAALFFAGVFGAAHNDRIDKAFTSIEHIADIRNGRLCSGSCASNIHLALAVANSHQDAITQPVIRWLEQQQTPTGAWEHGIPFYPTFWMLAHLRLREAETPFLRALDRVRQSQHHDGSWGHGQRLLHTFLVLDALSCQEITYQVA